MDVISTLAAEVLSKNFPLVIAGDFNLSIGTGYRGESLQALCDEFKLKIANGDGDASDSNRWTYRSGAGDLRRIDFILISSALHMDNTNTNRCIDLGSDHRCVSARLVFQRNRRQ